MLINAFLVTIAIAYTLMLNRMAPQAYDEAVIEVSEGRPFPQ